MSHPFPEFARPPVVELVLGAQFAPLANFSSGHLGWYWKHCLDQEWVRAVDAVPLQDQFETFDEHRRWRVPGVQVMLEPMAAPSRLQITNQSGDRMIQVQPTRFHYNWIKKEGTYPRYEKVLEEFRRRLARFEHFTEEADLGQLILNQWELTYVDRIPAGELWESPADWHRVLPGLLAPPVPLPELAPETVGGGEWHFEISPQRGRLHVSAQLAKWGDAGEPALLLQMTARGPISKEGGDAELKSGLDLGHNTTVEAFLRLTSPQAHAFWGRKG